MYNSLFSASQEMLWMKCNLVFTVFPPLLNLTHLHLLSITVIPRT